MEICDYCKKETNSKVIKIFSIDINMSFCSKVCLCNYILNKYLKVEN